MEELKYFFSYSRTDSEFVLKLAKELRAVGANVWLDQLDILGGQHWDRTIEETLKSCKGMIAVLSPEAVASENVMDEVSYALNKGKLVVPVMLRPCSIPLRLERVQYIDFTSDYETGFSQLIRALGIEQPVQPLESTATREPVAQDSAAPLDEKPTEPLVHEKQTAKEVEEPALPRASEPAPDELDHPKLTGPETEKAGSENRTAKVIGAICIVALIAIVLIPVFVNNAPVANDDVGTVAEGGTRNINVVANDTDSDGNIVPNTVVYVAQPANGSIAVNSDGTVDYTHNGSETLVDSFTYTVNDNDGATSNEVTVTITVTPVNDAPVAKGDSGTVAEGGTLNIDVVANDTDPDPNDMIDRSAVKIVKKPDHGDAVPKGDGTVDYKHAGSEMLDDSFTYTVNDNDGATSNEVTVTITVTPVNDAPVAKGDSGTVAEGGTLNIDVVANDTDPDPDPNDMIDRSAVKIVTKPGHGDISVKGDGTVDYTHNGSETLDDSFTYTVDDYKGAGSNEATVTITVTPVNDAPVARGDSGTVAEGGTLHIDVVANDTDSDGKIDPNTVVCVDKPADGDISVNSDGTVDYKHYGLRTVGDLFTYTVDDYNGARSNVAVVKIGILAPSASDVVTNSIGMELVYVPKGNFFMGSGMSKEKLAQKYNLPEEQFTDEFPPHWVSISKGFWMSNTEVTQGQYRQVMDAEPWSGKDYVQADDNNPAVYVSWKNAEEFCEKLNELDSQEGKSYTYRLPTEAEWEYACRANTETPFSFGDSNSAPDEYAWFRNNAYDKGLKYAQPVCKKEPNPWGLYDMHGNVWEWCSDWYDEEYYSKSPNADPNGPSSGRFHSLRGGCWQDGEGAVRCAVRHSYNKVPSGNPPDLPPYLVGFRVVCSK